MKTTNAKTRAFQTPAGPMSNKDLEKTHVKPTNSRRPKPRALHAETVKVDVLEDDIGISNERDVEYCAPKPKDLPYESEDFPDGCLNYDMLRGPNLMRGWQSYYYDPVNENGVSRSEKQFDEAIAKALKEADEKIRKAVEEAEWTVGDVPETFVNQQKDTGNAQKVKTKGQTKKSSNLSSRGPATVTSKNAAAALSVIPKAPLGAPKSIKSESKPTASFLARGKSSIPAPVNLSEMRHTAAAVASRSTIGYTKGRSTSNVLHVGFGAPPRSTSNLSTGSDTTITPSRFAQKKFPEDSSDEWRRLKFLGVFDTDDDDLELGLRGVLPECLRKDDDYEEEFVLTLSDV
jgi:vacuolar-type H+-ATPase subunit H